jgi:type II secretion system protein I
MKHRGISLLETVAAATILATAVMTVCGLSAKGLRSVRLNQEQEMAWDFLDRQLVLIDTVGVEVLAETGSAAGHIQSFDGRLWQWTAQAEAAETAGLYDVQVRVEWLSGNRPKQITCRTRLCGEPAALDETTPASQGAAP